MWDKLVKIAGKNHKEKGKGETEREWEKKILFIKKKGNADGFGMRKKKQGLGKGIVCCFLCHKKQDKLRRTKHSKDDG